VLKNRKIDKPRHIPFYITQMHKADNNDNDENKNAEGEEEKTFLPIYK